MATAIEVPQLTSRRPAQERFYRPELDGLDIKRLPMPGITAHHFLGTHILNGLYVFHVLAIAIANHFGFGGLKTALAGLGLTVCFVSVFYYLLEQPFLRLKSHFAHVQSRPEG